MSNYGQNDPSKPDEQQRDKKLGTGQNPPPKPGQQADLPDQTNPKSRTPDKHEKEGASGQEKGLIHQRPGLEGG